VVDGTFSLPEGPGLGITLNEAFVAEHPRQSVHLDLFADDWHKRQATND
jgi:galactonate dehydratase